jgi:hypothetical protein
VEYCGIEKEEEVVALEISNERFLRCLVALTTLLY